MLNQSLTHHGVLGMHWGHRKGSDSSSSQDHKTAQSLKSKKLSDMTNEELRVITNRMQLERQFKEARKQDMSSGKKFVADVLNQAGRQVAATYIAKFLTNEVESLIDMIKSKRK